MNEYIGAIFPDDYGSVLAPCNREVFGTPDNIDSGLRHHIDNCDECQELADEK